MPQICAKDERQHSEFTHCARAHINIIVSRDSHLHYGKRQESRSNTSRNACKGEIQALSTNCGKVGSDRVKKGSRVESKLFYNIFDTEVWVKLHILVIFFYALLLLSLVSDSNVLKGALRIRRIVVYAHRVIASNVALQYVKRNVVLCISSWSCTIYAKKTYCNKDRHWLIAFSIGLHLPVICCLHWYSDSTIHALCNSCTLSRQCVSFLQLVITANCYNIAIKISSYYFVRLCPAILQTNFNCSRYGKNAAQHVSSNIDDGDGDVELIHSHNNLFRIVKRL